MREARYDPGARHEHGSGSAPCAQLAYKFRRTADVDDHAACLTNWRQQYDQLSAGRFAGEFEEMRFGTTQLFCEVLDRSVHQEGEAWAGSLTVAVPVTLQGLGWFNGADFGTHSMVLIHNDCEFDFRTPQMLNLLACTVDADALSHHAERIEQRDLAKELAGRALVPTDPEKIDNFKRLMLATMAELRDRPGLARHAAARAAMQQALYHAIVRACIPGLPTAPGRQRATWNTGRRTAMRARDYMLAHIDEPLTIARVCTELEVPRRTLQQSFEDVFGLSPVRVLRALRLNGVRRALRELPEDAAATIADVAAEWGFWHLSHFSAAYKALFGELPSQTLKNRH